ncbi:NAD-dependent epimerase/dehydratase family protein [Carboxylicivirga mesophila]|uniref:NAD-dependent epimerase/dehydratase family protein n=1 Tax=Carboxylicivirga mesophila TaxID=1166478 RepID=A0ABS5KEW0_9BACT|nr:NAD-dependent epimerase/dehydratase family protein [Carboxylicivirga mesophila]MBS2213585.1 NAD-dependent epimerase/dehydratase family protein [Carboxylicivirga mesophila]
MKVIITGSTGMVGKGALLECLDSPLVSKVLVINRNSVGIHHPKLEEIIHKNFSDLSAIKDRLAGYDACFHCMGISAVGLSEAQYTEITYTMTKELADTLYSLNPQMVFSYVSGAGTDSSEKGRVMWARVKGKTENMILNKGFKDAYAFRPGAILPEKGIKSRTSWYNAFYLVLRPFFPLLRKMNSVTSTTKIGQAMIQLVQQPSNKKILENKDINSIVA